MDGGERDVEQRGRGEKEGQKKGGGEKNCREREKKEL